MVGWRVRRRGASDRDGVLGLAHGVCLAVSVLGCRPAALHPAVDLRSGRMIPTQPAEHHHIMSNQFDVIVGGPGGYIAAIRAAQLGNKVACIDEWKNAKGGAAPGGTCTNVGCIPSKALLQSSEHFDHASHHFADHGIEVKGVSMHAAKMVARKDAVVKQNNDGILYLFKKNKVSFFHGRASFVKAVEGGYEIKVAGAAEETMLGQQAIMAKGYSA